VDGIGLPGAGRNCNLLLFDRGAHKILASAKVDDSNNLANVVAGANIPPCFTRACSSALA
jgi:hypothetical protein